MTTEFPADAGLRSTFGPIWSRRRVSTHHLLGCVAQTDQVRLFLDGYHLAPKMLRAGAWAREDEPGQAEVAVAGASTDRPLSVSTAAAEAFERCRQQASLIGLDSQRSALDLLAALLEDASNSAVQCLQEWGVDAVELRAALETGKPPQGPDPMPEELRATRDALVGRRHYRTTQLDRFWVKVVLRVFRNLNLAAHPVVWARLEAAELAERHGGRLRTDDVLLALLTTYTVGLAHPHLAQDAPEDWAAGRCLTEAGITPDRLRPLMAGTDLGEDRVPARKLLGDWPPTTAGLLDQVLSEPESRSVRALTLLGADPTTLRSTVSG